MRWQMSSTNTYILHSRETYQTLTMLDFKSSSKFCISSTVYIKIYNDSE